MAEYNYTPEFLALYKIMEKHDLIGIAYVADDEYDAEVNALLEILKGKVNFTKEEIEQEIRNVYTAWFSESLVKNVSAQKITAMAQEVIEWNKKKNLKQVNI